MLQNKYLIANIGIDKAKNKLQKDVYVPPPPRIRIALGQQALACTDAAAFSHPSWSRDAQLDFYTFFLLALFDMVFLFFRL